MLEDHNYVTINILICACRMFMLYLPYQMGGYSLKIINQNVELISQQKIDILL